MIVIGLVIAALLLLVLIYFTFDVILLIFAAALLAIFLRGLADLLGVVIDASESWRVVIVSTILLAVLVGAVALLAPSVGDQAAHLRDELPRFGTCRGRVYLAVRLGQNSDRPTSEF